MAEKLNFTDTRLKALVVAPKGQRYEVMDGLQPGLGVRVTDSGHKSFFIRTRIPGRLDPKTGQPTDAPVRRIVGEVGKVAIDDARATARDWLKMMSRGIDPQEEQRRETEAAAAKRRAELASSFRALSEAYLRHKRRAGHRRVDTTEREINRHLVSRWADVPAAQITRRDVTKVIEELADAGKQRTAHDIFGHARSMFGWAIDTGDFGMEHSPCDRVKPSRLIGAKKFRQRVLTDAELRAYWRATRHLGYPLGPFYRLLLLTGQRLSEVAGMRRRELHPELAKLLGSGDKIDWPRVPAAVKVWTIPPERFKSGLSHIVPLSDVACEVLRGLPVFRKGDHLFTNTLGMRPINGFGQAKAKLDKRMLLALRARARAAGEVTSVVTLEPWVQHDVRRTVRTRLSGLRVPQEVAEMVIGHGKKGLGRVYDQHQFMDEMREALEAWAARLLSIAEPPPDNVVALAARRVS